MLLLATLLACNVLRISLFPVVFWLGHENKNGFDNAFEF
jgi:hypothetical protein